MVNRMLANRDRIFRVFRSIELPPSSVLTVFSPALVLGPQGRLSPPRSRPAEGGDAQTHRRGCLSRVSLKIPAENPCRFCYHDTILREAFVYGTCVKIRKFCHEDTIRWRREKLSFAKDMWINEGTFWYGNVLKRLRSILNRTI